MDTTMEQKFREIFRDKKVFITGHTGFKGSWLTLWLIELGAKVYGYALPPPTNPSLFETLNLRDDIHNEVADVRDYFQLKECISRVKPDIIFHLAAQSMVRESYVRPVETIQVNTMGTVNVMEAVREADVATVLIMVTSDKCYENGEWLFGYRENDPLGGHDPYSASKGAAEILINSWRRSFFNTDDEASPKVKLASARAGNVVGGGDWTKDHIVPDCIRALKDQLVIPVRNPYATRPWQHVLEPLSGYLSLGARLLDPQTRNANEYCEAFNFGPYVTSNKSVKALVEKIILYWGNGSWKLTEPEKVYHESSLLNLSFDKAHHKLQWLPRWNFDETISRTIDWYVMASEKPTRIREFTLEQIRQYQSKDPVIPYKSQLQKQMN